MEMDHFTGDPQIHSKQEVRAPTYDEGPLQAQPVDMWSPTWNNDLIEDDFEDEVKTYPFGESAYLNTQFLQAIGTLWDRGLAADGLCLVQLEGEFWYLAHWDKRLAEQERNLVKE
jgi:hypothetical protein